MTKRLKDKGALLTGSAARIGQAAVIEYAREGADMVVKYPSATRDG